MSKQRNRPSLVCTFCKKRKVKCNKGIPCSTCVKYGNSKCVYEETVIKDKDDYIREIRYLKSKIPDETYLKLSVPFENPHGQNRGIRMEIDDDDETDDSQFASSFVGNNTTDPKTSYFKFNHNIESYYLVSQQSRHHSGVLSWFYMYCSDKKVQAFVQYVIHVKMHYGFNAYIAEHPHEKYFEQKIDAPPKTIEFVSLRTIESLLPTPEVVEQLVETYFRKYYLLWPFLDEHDFKMRFRLILSRDNSIKINSNIDYAFLGTVLLVIKLVNAFEKVAHFDPNHQLTDIAGDIYFQYFGRYEDLSFELTQFLLYLVIADKYLPSEGGAECGGEIKFKKLINFCYHIGLHLDPNNFTKMLNNPKTNHISRKIWYYLVWLDITHYFYLGTNLTIESGSYNVLPPFHEPGNENNSDLQLELQSLKFYEKFEQTWNPFIELAHKLSGIDKAFNTDSLTNILNDIENVFIKNFNVSLYKPGQVPSSDYQSLQNAFELEAFLSVFDFLISVYFNFYIYYNDSAKDVSFYFLKKGFFLITRYFVPIITYICKLPLNDFARVLLAPKVSLLVSKVSCYNDGALIRVKRLLLSDFSNHPSYAKLLGCLINLVNILVENMSILSMDYFNSYRLMRTSKFFTRFILDSDTYKIGPINDKVDMGNCEYTDVRANELVEIFLSTKFEQLTPISMDSPMSDSLSKTATLISSEPLSTTPYSIDEVAKDYLFDKDLENFWFQMNNDVNSGELKVPDDLLTDILNFNENFFSYGNGSL